MRSKCWQNSFEVRKRNEIAQLIWDQKMIWSQNISPLLPLHPYSKIFWPSTHHSIWFLIVLQDSWIQGHCFMSLIQDSWIQKHNFIILDVGIIIEPSTCITLNGCLLNTEASRISTSLRGGEWKNQWNTLYGFFIPCSRHLCLLLFYTIV